MSEGDKYDNFVLSSNDGAISARDSMGASIGEGKKASIRNAEENPEKPLDKGEAADKAGGILNAGEKNQKSDKASSGGWANKTGTKANIAAGLAGGAVGGGVRTALWASKKMSKGGLMGGIKVAGPAGTIIIVLVMCFFFIMAGAGSLVSALIGVINDRLDTLDIAIPVRSEQIISSIFQGKNTEGGVWHNLTDVMKSRFAKSGISVETNAAGVDVAKYNNGNKVVTVSDYLAEKKNSTVFSNMNQEATAAVGGSEGAYDSPTIVGRIKNFFKFTFSDKYKADASAGGSTNAEDVVNSSLAEGLSEATPGSMNGKVEGGAEGTVEVEDAVDGKTTESGVVTGRSSTEIDASSNAEATVSEMVENEVGKGADFNFIAQAAKGLCQLYNTATTINRMIKAYEAAQVIAMGLRIFEAIQRMQAGDGGDDIVNVFSNYLTRQKTTEFEVESGEYKTITTSAIGSTAVAAFFGGMVLTDNDTIVQSFITSSNQFRKITGAIDTSGGYKACAATNVVASISSVIVDFATFGTARLVGLVASVGLSVGISVLVSAVVSVMVPKIVNALKRDFMSFVEGAEGGGVIAWAAEMVVTESEKMAGMSVGTKETLNAYVQKKAEVVAERAQYYRSVLSPFDPSSEYTFVGSLMASLRRASLDTSSIVGRIGNIASVVGKALVSLTPASHAGDAIDQIITTGDHPSINSLVNDGQERLATAFGEPYYIPDFSTSGDNVEDVMWYLDAKGCFDEPYDPVSNPNPAIRMGGTSVASTKNPIILAIKAGRDASNDAMLAAYTDGGNLADEFVLADVSSSENNICALTAEEKIGRNAPLGVPDAEIEAKYQPANTGVSILDKVIGAIPIIGGILDTVNSVDTLAHMSNILGDKYQRNTKENLMVQRYTTDQLIGEAMGVYDKSQMNAYIEKYREMHPEDNTTVGMIARRSGLSKDQVITAFRQINALLFIADYHPDGLGPLFFEEPATQITLESSSSETHQNMVSIIYNSTISDRKRAQNITA